jgi:hypothetical protein
MAASSTEACLIIISLFLYVLVDASTGLQAQLKLGSSLFFNFNSLVWWLQAQLKLR